MEQKPRGLKSKVFSGISWLGLSRISVQLFSFVATAILARLLSPNEFGLMGIAIITINFMNVVSEFGIARAIIQRKEMDDVVLSSAFWPNLGLGFVMFGLAVLLSGRIAGFFGAPEARGLIIVLSLSLIINSFSVIQRGILYRNLEFRKIFFRQILDTLAYVIFSVSFALLGFGVWSLVFGTLARSLVGSITFWTAVKWRPAFTFNVSSFKEIYGFGLKVLFNGILGFFTRNSDYTLIGKFLGTRDLGIYSIAYNVGTLARSKISSIVGGVIVPAYSRIQDDHKRMERASSEATQYLALISFPVSFGLLAVAPEFIQVIYGPKWVDAILPAQILLLSGVLLAINPALDGILTSIGRPGTAAIWNTIKTAFLIFAIYVGLKLGGIVGVAAGVTIATFVSTPISHFLSYHFIGGNVWFLWKRLAILALPGIAMALGVFGLKKILEDFISSNVLLLGSEVIFGVGSGHS